MAKSSLICAVALLVVCGVTYVQAMCNVCQPNGIACTGESTFRLCFNGQADQTQVLNCPPNTVCSRSSLRCVDKANNQPLCNPSRGCGICNGKMFTCTSRTTFAQCNGNQLTTVTGKCPNGMLCNSNEMEICQDSCTPTPETECQLETPVAPQ